MNPVVESCVDVEMVENGLDGSVLNNEPTEHNANTAAVQSAKSNVILPLILLLLIHILFSYFKGKSTRKDCNVIVSSAIQDKKFERACVSLLIKS